MITRHLFIQKLRKWLSEETCNKLADMAEEQFDNVAFFSCYEFMLIRMYERDGDELVDYIDNNMKNGFIPDKEDDFEGLAKFMETEW